MNVYDCFLFCHELDVLEIRLRTLYPHVTKFILAESPRTFTGALKPLFFNNNRERFSEFSDKIIHLIVPEKQTATAIDQERYQRDYLAHGLSGVEPADLVFVNDADEIWNPAILDQVSIDTPTRLEPYWAQYFLNLRVYDVQWPHMRVCRGAFLKDHTPSEVRWSDPTVWIGNAGWHLQNMGGPDAVAFKCRSFTHAEHCHESWKETWQKSDYIAESLRQMFDAPSELNRIPLAVADKSYLPQSVLDDWPSWIKRGFVYLAPKLKSRVVELPNKMMAQISRIFLTHQLSGLSGDVVEAGCNNGLTSVYLQSWMLAHEYNGVLHCFDAFNPTPSDCAILEHEMRDGNVPLASVESFQALFLREGIPMPVIHEGLFAKTMPHGLPKEIALALVDCDYYLSAVTALMLILPRMKKGGVVLVHDYEQSIWGAGIQAAVKQVWQGEVKLECEFAVLRIP